MKKKPITLNPANKGATKKRMATKKGLNKDKTIKKSVLDADIKEKKKKVKASIPGSAARKKAVKELRQDVFAKTFGKRKR